MKMVLEVKDTGRPYEVDAKFNSLPFFASKWKADVFSLIAIAFFLQNKCVRSTGRWAPVDSGLRNGNRNCRDYMLWR